METKSRLYRVDRPDRFKTFLRRLGRSGISRRSNGNEALDTLSLLHKRYECATGGGGGGGLEYKKGRGARLSGVNFRFWSRLGC